MNIWYKLNSAEVIQQLNTNADRGLSSTEVANRLKQYSCNELTEKPGESLWHILWKQLRESGKNIRLDERSLPSKKWLCPLLKFVVTLVYRRFQPAYFYLVILSYWKLET
jgi:magnesium-transporting ATPase (P-type)